MDDMDSQLVHQGARVKDVERQMRELGDRLLRVEKGEASGEGMGPDRRALWCLVAGKPNSERRLAVGPQGDFDWASFCTGLRRSVALCNFRKRDGEADDGCRGRMPKVLQTTNAAKVEKWGVIDHCGAPFPRSPEERGRAALAALVQKCVMKLQPSRAEDVEVEFNSGMTWIRDDQVSGSGSPPRSLRRPGKAGLTRAPLRNGARWTSLQFGKSWKVRLADIAAERDSEIVPGGQDFPGEPQSISHVSLAVDRERDSALTPRQAAKKSGEPGFKILGWNIGGAELMGLPTAVADTLSRRQGKDDLVLLQQLPREGQGWTYNDLGGRRVVAHGAQDQWHGTRLWYDQSAWCVVKVAGGPGSNFGTWNRISSYGLAQQISTPGFSVDKYGHCKSVSKTNMQAVYPDQYRKH